MNRNSVKDKLLIIYIVCYNWAHSFHQFGDAVRTVVEDREKLIDLIGILHHELGVVEIAQLEDRLQDLVER